MCLASHVSLSILSQYLESQSPVICTYVNSVHQWMVAQSQNLVLAVVLELLYISGSVKREKRVNKQKAKHSSAT